MLYQILGFSTWNVDNGCDAEREADTLKDAKKIGRYMKSEEYRKACEASDRLQRVQIFCRGECVHEVL